MSGPVRRLTDAELAQLARDVTPEGLVSWEGEAQDRIYDAAPALVQELLELRALRDELARHVDAAEDGARAGHGVPILLGLKRCEPRAFHELRALVGRTRRIWGAS